MELNEDELARAFLRVDRDNNGRIDRFEFEELVVVLQKQRLEEGTRSDVFDRIDTNDDGLITLDEFRAWWAGEVW